MIGSSTAQFHRFVQGPSQLLAYWRSGQTNRWGHNPFGALSVIALLICLIVQTATGLASDDEIFTTGPLAQFLTESQVGWANQIHEWNSKLLFALIGLHVAAIVYYQAIKRLNLIGPMFSGKVNVPDQDARLQSLPKFKPAWLWVSLALGSAWLAWMVFQL